MQTLMDQVDDDALNEGAHVDALDLTQHAQRLVHVRIELQSDILAIEGHESGLRGGGWTPHLMCAGRPCDYQPEEGTHGRTLPAAGLRRAGRRERMSIRSTGERHSGRHSRPRAGKGCATQSHAARTRRQRRERGLRSIAGNASCSPRRWLWMPVAINLRRLSNVTASDRSKRCVVDFLIRRALRALCAIRGGKIAVYSQ